MNVDPITIDTDVLVIGSGAAGMYAAIAAARGGAHVLLVDRSLIGRSGATVMAQMTVAAALGEEAPDDPANHYRDTIAAGRGLCEEKLAQLLCEDAPDCIRELDRWGVGWARKDGHITATAAPGHDRPRCVYVDFINTGPAVSKTLRTHIARNPAIRKIGDLCVVDLVVGDGEAVGAVGYHVGSGAPVVIAAKATVLATGGLTRLYRRNSASTNMGGDGYALALRAGGSLIDMEFVQFFPIGHLAPRLIGMDPIMWDPFRYKLGGRLLNGRMEEFTSAYGSDEDGRYVLTRDLATYAILKEVEAGRGSPHGGAWLSFQHCSEAALREAFGPVIDRLAANAIDLTRQPVEVAPIAHYHMGGVKADAAMATELPGLYAAGEVVGGASGANRLSGNALTEAFVFGRRAGKSAGERARRIASQRPRPQDATAALDLVRANGGRRERTNNTAAMIARLQAIMADDVGPLRTGAKLDRALGDIAALAAALGELPPGNSGAFNLERLDWFDLRNMLAVARTVAQSARNRTESRGAHQREDYPHPKPQWQRHQVAQWRARALQVSAESSSDAAAVMSQETKRVATLKIWRGSDRDAGHFDSYEVPFEPGQSVLDGLRWIRINKDPALAIRFSCINANACKECMIQLDGETIYACTARLESREMKLAPLPNKKLIRDLVTEIAPPSERFGPK